MATIWTYVQAAQMATVVTDIIQVIDQIHEYHKIKGKIKHELPDIMVRISEDVNVIYERDWTAVYHLMKENLILKRIKRFNKYDKESNIALMMNHENVAKTFLTIQAKKDNIFEELIVCQYYEGAIDEEAIKTSDDLYNYSCQIANGIEYLHSQNICHNDIAPRNIRYTNYDKTINEEQKSFILGSYENLKKRIDEDSRKAEDQGQRYEKDKKERLIYTDVRINEKTTNYAIETIGSGILQKTPTYVLVDFGSSQFFGNRETYLLNIEGQAHTEEELVKKERYIAKRLLVDVYNYGLSICYIKELILLGKEYKYADAYKLYSHDDGYVKLQRSTNPVERLLYKCLGTKKLRPSIKVVRKSLPDKVAWEEFVGYKCAKLDHNPWGRPVLQ